VVEGGGRKLKCMHDQSAVVPFTTVVSAHNGGMDDGNGYDDDGGVLRLPRAKKSKKNKNEAKTVRGA